MEREQRVPVNRNPLSEAGICYSACPVFLMFASLILSLAFSLAGEGVAEAQWYRYLNYLLPQICFALAIVLFFVRSGVSVKQTYVGCKWYYFFIALALQFGLLFSLNALNGYFIGFLQKFGYQEQGSLLPSLDGWRLLPAILVIAVLPALFEETIFRGIISRQMFESGWGLWAAALISGALFSLFHHNPEQTVYQFIWGVCFTLVALRSGSVFPTMVAHFLNNATILTLDSFLAPKYGADWALESVLPFGGYLALMILSAVCFVGALVFLIFLDRRNTRRGGVKDGKRFFFAAAIGIAICAFEWIFTLVTGFMNG